MVCDTVSKHLVLSSVGPYECRYRGMGYVEAYKAATGEPVCGNFGGSSIGIGEDGAHGHLFPFKIVSVQTAVARYEDILRVI